MVASAQVVGWTSNYQETLKELGLEDGDIGFPEGPDRGMTLLVNKYITRMRGTLHTWFVNILQVSAPSGTDMVADPCLAPGKNTGVVRFVRRKMEFMIDQIMPPLCGFQC